MVYNIVEYLDNTLWNIMSPLDEDYHRDWSLYLLTNLAKVPTIVPVRWLTHFFSLRLASIDPLPRLNKRPFSVNQRSFLL